MCIIGEIFEVVLVVSHALVLLVELPLHFPILADILVLHLDHLVVLVEHRLVVLLIDYVTKKMNHKINETDGGDQ